MAKKQKPKKDNRPLKSKVKTHQLVGYPDFFTNTRLHVMFIMLLAFVLYGNTLGHKYTQDDAIVIYDNMYTTKGIKGIPGLLKDDTFFGFFKEAGKANLVEGGRYRPLSLVMFAIETQFFAKKKKDANGKVVKDKDGDVVYDPLEMNTQTGIDKANAIKKVGHFMNILMFGFCGIMLYLVLLKLLIPYKGTRFAYFVAIVTTLLFMTHPIHTEAVANIKGRDEIMTLLGSLAALYFSLRAYFEKNNSFNIVAGLVFFLALLSKENAITFVGIVPVAFYFFTKADLKTIAIQTVPLLIASVVFVGIRQTILNKNKPTSGVVANTTKDLMNDPFQKIVGNKYVPFTTGERAATVVYTWGKYLQLLFIPHQLTHDYYPRHIEMMSFGTWQVLLSLLLFLALIVYGLYALMKKDELGFGILFFLMSFSIVSNVVFSIGTNMAERLMFMPSVGFCFVLAILAYRFVTKGKKDISFSKLQPMLFAALMISLLYSVKTVTRNFAWKDNYTLFMTDIKTSPNSAKLRNAVGGELTTRSVREKNEAKKNQMLEEAVVNLKEAIKIHPTYKNSYLQLGNAHNYLHKYDQSIQYYKQGLTMFPNDKNLNNNINITYREAGRYYGEEKGELQKSIQYLLEAYKLEKDDYQTIRLLGIAYGMGGNNTKAIEYFKKAVDLEPKSAEALFYLGNSYHNAGNPEQGEIYRQRAFKIDPNVGKRKQ